MYEFLLVIISNRTYMQKPTMLWNIFCAQKFFVHFCARCGKFFSHSCSLKNWHHHHFFSWKPGFFRQKWFIVKVLCDSYAPFTYYSTYILGEIFERVGSVNRERYGKTRRWKKLEPKKFLVTAHLKCLWRLLNTPTEQNACHEISVRRCIYDERRRGCASQTLATLDPTT